jgi:FKBP-type peptidyl-prolyl cis-trans isomerase
MDPQTGQPVAPQPDPILTAIFAPNPVDAEPTVAMLRTEELGRAAASSRYQRFPKEWGQGLLQAYEQARQAAGIATVQEQQQAAQQQMQAQQQAQQAESQQAAQAKQMETQARMQQEQMRGQTAIQVAKIDEEGDVIAEQLRYKEAIRRGESR